MENFIEIENYLANEKDGNIVKERKNPFYGLLTLLIGIIVTIVSIQCKIPETVQMACLSAGVISVLVGSVMLVLVYTSDSGNYRFKTTGARLCRYRRYIATADRQQLIEYVNSGNMRLLQDINKETSTGTMLQAFIANDGYYAIVQVEEYIPYSFTPCTPPVTLDKENATLLLQWIKH